MAGNTNDYPYIRAWGKLMGSYRYFIEDEIDRARSEGAPLNATSRGHDGTWSTTDDIVSDDTRKQMGLEPLPNSALPPKYQIVIDVDWSEERGAVLTLSRAGRQIYRDKFDDVRTASDRALLEIMTDQRGPKTD